MPARALWTRAAAVGAVLATLTAPPLADAGSRHNVHSRGFTANETWTPYLWAGGRSTHVADVTGDGRADAIALDNEAIYVKRSSGTAFGTQEKWTENGFYGDKTTQFADVTGDGKVDAIAVTSSSIDTITVRRSNGSGFGANERWVDVPFYGDRGTLFADVTGDGKADAIAITSSSTDTITVRPSTGSGFGAPARWSDAIFWGSRGTHFADVNGDGRADAIAVTDTGVRVRRSTGSSLGASEGWTPGAFYGDVGTLFADVTGDRRADAIAITTSSTDRVSVRRSDGTQFEGNEPWTDVPFYGSRLTAIADVTGDRRADAVAINEDGHHVRRSDTQGLLDPTAHEGGGVLLFNRPGYYYMGRLFPGQELDREGLDGINHRADGVYYSDPDYNGGHVYTYRFGYARGSVNRCFWLGPRANSGPFVEYVTGTLLTGTPDECPAVTNDAGVVGSTAWLANRENVGSQFNCDERGTNGSNANGPAPTTMLATTTLYHNLAWRSDYRGGSGADPAGTVNAGETVGYRFRTDDLQWAVIFHPTYGWGFVPAGTVPVTGGYADEGAPLTALRPCNG